MTDLPDHIYEKIEELSEQGNVLLEDKGNAAGAIVVWQKALALLPEPKAQWEAALWLYASIGEADRATGQFAEAKDMLFNALNCPDGHMNPLVLLRLGQTLVDLGNKDQGAEYLLRAYMLEGADLFEGDGAPYLAFLRQRKLVN